MDHEEGALLVDAKEAGGGKSPYSGPSHLDACLGRR